MRELREETFSGNINEDAHDHVDRVLNIVSLFNILGMSHDAILLRVFPFTLTGAAKRWVDRLTLGAISTWDLLKKAFIQRYCPPSKIAKRLEDIHNFKQEIDESLYQAWERFNDLLYKCPTHDINSHQKVNIFYKGLSAMNRQLLDSQGPIPGMTPTQALTVIKTMADHSQKWHDRTLSRSLSSSSNTDGRAAVDVKSAKDLTLTKNVLSTRKPNRATNEIPSSSTGQCKVVTDDLETQHRPISSRKLINKEGWTTKYLQCQLPPKELNLRSFTLPCTIGNFNFYGMADLDFAIINKTHNETIILGRPFSAAIHAEINVFDKEISLGTNNDRVSYDMEKRDHNFTIPTEKIFMIKFDLDNRPLTPASSNNQPRNLHDRSLNDSLHDQNRKKIKIGLDQHISGAHFCKPVKQTIDEQTKMWPTCDPTKGMCDGGNKIYEVSKVGTLSFWYCNYDNERNNITGVGLSFPDYLLAKYGKYQTNSLIGDDTYVEWCNTSYSPGTPSQETKNLRPSDYTFREWTLLKVGHTNISEVE
ncbi:hypothetical protein Tco_0465351 [Tanacetum coccineum]